MAPKRKRKNLAIQKLENLLGEVVTVYLQSGRAIVGRLLSFDDESLSIQGEAQGSDDPVIARSHVSTFRRATPDEVNRHEGKRKHGRPS